MEGSADPRATSSWRERPEGEDDIASRMERGSSLGGYGLSLGGAVGRVPRYTTFVVATAATLWILVELRPVLQPLVLSVLIWFVLSAIARLIARLVRGRGAEPGRAALAASGVVFGSVVVALTLLLSDSIANFREHVPEYRENLRVMLENAAGWIGVTSLPRLSELAEGERVNEFAFEVLGSVAGSLAQIVIIVCFVFFIFYEAKRFGQKTAALVADDVQRERLSRVLAEISRRIETYLGMKCLIGVIQAVPTWAILVSVGVDSPIVWAVFVFFLSFIPTLGSLIGIALPSALALVQFDTIEPFLITLALLAPLQILASNWLEPRLMGDSLNLSPFAVFLAIFGGGTVWGVTGALISVPALTVVAIALAQSERTRSAAILLSRDGRLIA
ncbi:MAG: AI-2E family transporter [Paracoccaceae bacterium]